MKIVATARKALGSGASRRLRREGKVPGIVYGGEAEPVSITLDHNPLFHSLRVEEFHSSILDLELDGATQQVLLRDVNWHAYKPQVMHVDFQRVAANEEISVAVPLHFLNEETAPAVKLQGAIINHVVTELEVTCLPANLPKFIEVDLGNLSIEEPVHLSQVKLPKGVTVPPQGGSADPVLASAAIVEENAEDAAADAAEAEAAAAASAAADAAAEKK